jgi:hypothetical protein
MTVKRTKRLEGGRLSRQEANKAPDQKFKKSELLYSRPLDVHRWSEHPEVKAAVDHIFREMEELGMVSRGVSKDKLKRHLRVVVLDLFHCHIHTPRMFVGYSRNNNDFSAPERYDKLFIKRKPLCRAVDGLTELGYIEHYAGFYDRRPGGKGFQSRMRATRKLIDLIERRYRLIPAMVGEFKGKERELIVLKAPKDKQGRKRPIDYEDTPETHEMRENARKFNAILDQTDIRLAVNDALIPQNIDLSRKRLHRVFNNASWDHGGRFFGPWWQNIPRALRRYILIESRSTAELDYSGLHVKLLYAQDGIHYTQDPYQYAGPELRDHLKLILLCSLNASDKTSALKAMRKEMREKPDLYPQDKVEGKKLNGIVEEFLLHHAPISKHFYTGIGTRLQNLDSKIAESVMLELIEWDTFALPVHDSFVCCHLDSGRVFQAMRNAFMLHLGGYLPQVKHKEWLTAKETVELIDRFGIVL